MANATKQEEHVPVRGGSSGEHDGSVSDVSALRRVPTAHHLAERVSGWLDAAGRRRRWWTTFTLVALLGGLWLIGTPLYASPDEANHAVRAVSVARGELLGAEVTGIPQKGRVLVHVPESYAADLAGCFAFKPEVPASCARVGYGTGIVPAMISVGRYPPLIYLAAGVAARPFATVNGLYVMRLVNVVLCAALMASAFVSLAELRDRRLANLAALVVLTPSVVFLFGVLNPSGPEIAAGIGTWTSGHLLATEPTRAGDRRLVARFAVAALALLVSRPLGPLWVGLIGGALVVLSGGRSELSHGRPWGQLGRLARSRPVRVAAALGAFVALAEGAWLVLARSFEYSNPEIARSGSFGSLLRQDLGVYWDRGVVQMIGSFGWLDTPAPRGVLVAWLALAGFVVLSGVAVARTRAVVVVGGILVLSVAIPAVVDALNADRGFEWQARYTLPLTVGAPLVAAFEAGRWRCRPLFERRQVFVVAATLITLSQVACYWQAMRRNAVGISGRLLFWIDPAWQPPGVAPPLLIVAFALVTAALCAATFVLVPGRGAPAELGSSAS